MTFVLFFVFAYTNSWYFDSSLILMWNAVKQQQSKTTTTTITTSCKKWRKKTTKSSVNLRIWFLVGRQCCLRSENHSARTPSIKLIKNPCHNSCCNCYYPNGELHKNQEKKKKQKKKKTKTKCSAAIWEWHKNRLGNHSSRCSAYGHLSCHEILYTNYLSFLTVSWFEWAPVTHRWDLH